MIKMRENPGRSRFFAPSGRAADGEQTGGRAEHVRAANRSFLSIGHKSTRTTDRKSEQRPRGLRSAVVNAGGCRSFENKFNYRPRVFGVRSGCEKKGVDE